MTDLPNLTEMARATGASTHPMNNPAVAVELTMRERQALMTEDDWDHQIDRVLSWPVGAVTPKDIELACTKVGTP